jgi:small conductance mechanosensitive channel
MGTLANQHRPAWIVRLDEWHLLTPLRVLLVIVVAVVLTMLLKRVVHRLLDRTLHLTERFERNDLRAQGRQRALASSLRSSLVGVIWAIAVITIVGEVGVNIGAFVATATVVGGAIAFGAQTLVRDVIAGFFVLAEDQYGVGDDVDLGHAAGSVERITLRSARVRDVDGRVWFVPHGNVVRVANLSKAAQATLTVEVSRRSSIARVDEAAAALCTELAGDAVAAPLLAGDPRVVGLTEVLDDRLVYKLVVPTKPGGQDTVCRIWRVKALAAFSDGRFTAPE